MPQSVFFSEKKEGPKTIKRICKLASNKQTTCSKIKSTLNCGASRETISRYLRDSGNLKFIKKQAKPILKPEHKK